MLCLKFPISVRYVDENPIFVDKLELSKSFDNLVLSELFDNLELCESFDNLELSRIFFPAGHELLWRRTNCCSKKNFNGATLQYTCIEMNWARIQSYRMLFFMKILWIVYVWLENVSSASCRGIIFTAQNIMVVNFRLFLVQAKFSCNQNIVHQWSYENKNVRMKVDWF